MRGIKEHDLVLFSSEQLDIPGGNHDIKKLVNADFLRSLLIRQCCFFGFVTQKNIGSPKDPTQAAASIDCLIDFSKSTWLKLSEQTQSYTKLYVYCYESLATTFREYKTLRMSEFYGMADIILTPGLKLKETQQQKTERAILEGEDVKLMRQKMTAFYDKYKDQYNVS